MFGSLALSPGGAVLPAEVAHIGLDPLDPGFRADAVAARMRASRSAIKRVLLDQRVVSGIGNIYADESLWRARVHYATPAAAMSARRIVDLLDTAATVLREAIAAGGTSLDALYVGVDGASGYFERALAAYGRSGQPCPRCGRPIVREPFMGRSSFLCPHCAPSCER
jgi:formamidopyrimidine-DNA glycosylase